MKASEKEFASVEPYIVKYNDVYVVCANYVGLYESLCQKFGVDKLESYGVYREVDLKTIPLGKLTTREYFMIKEEFDSQNEYSCGSAADFKDWMLNDIKETNNADASPMKEFVEIVSGIVTKEFDHYLTANGWLK